MDDQLKIKQLDGKMKDQIEIIRKFCGLKPGQSYKDIQIEDK